MATPKIIPYEVQLRSTKIKRNISRPVVYTNDLNSAEFQFKITDMDAGELSTATATTLLYMRDGSFFQNPKEDVSLVGTTFSYTLKENEGNHGGLAQIQLVVTVSGMEFATQLFDFEIINGLETKVAQEVMIHDWTTLTREARAYIDEFAANEILREAEFDNNEFDRNTAFVSSQDARTLAFGTEQTNRGNAFTAEQNERTTAFNEAESGRTTAETGRVTAESSRVTAESGRVTKESQRVTAESSRVTAEGNRVTAESGRVTAENTRATNYATYNNKFTTLEARTEFEAANRVANGDFSNGSVGWTASNATLSTSNGSLIVTGNGSFSAGWASQPITKQSNNKYYIRAKARVTNSNCVRMQLGIGDAVGLNKNAPAINTWYDLSYIATHSTVDNNIYLYHHYADATIASGKVMEVGNVLAIDLTATFGAGKEPTLAEMDRLMARFPNSWFDGVKPIQTIETLYQEKANKAQEAWITPTLLNGWTSDSGNPIQYRKDEFGRVWVRGRCFGTSPGTIIFTFPTNYRPSIFHDPICSKFNTSTAVLGFGRVSVHSTGDLYLHSSTMTNERFDLSGVSFSTN